MTNLANLVRIVNGKMLNHPSVSAVESFSICAHKIHKKAAFIAVNASAKDVETAIANGAYAVIFDSDFKVSNDEVAFIKVENLNVALLRMIKFLGDIWRHQFVLIDEIQASILRFISVPKNLIFAPNTLHELFIHLISHEQKHIYFTKNREVLQLLEISYQKIEKDENLSETYSGSIFYSSFIYDEIYYSNLVFPQIFLPDLCGILKFLGRKNIEFRLQNFSALSHFEPIFVDKFLNITPFGESYRAFIIESDKELFVRAAQYLRAKFRDKILICASWDDEFGETAIDFRFSKLEMLKTIPEFHYALIYGNRADIVSFLSQKPREKNLFF